MLTITATTPPSELTKNQRSILLYCETCLVDKSGLLEGIRMNTDDLADLKIYQDAGILTFGRIPAALLLIGNAHNPSATHWVRFTDAAWALAGACRRVRAMQVGTYAKQVFAEVDARQAEAART